MVTDTAAGSALGATLHNEMRQAEALAWDAASRNKFWMFGYYAARVHYLRSLLGETGRGPFFEVKELAGRKVWQEKHASPSRTLDPPDDPPSTTGPDPNSEGEG